jgi:hypothetical protein
MIRTTLLVMVRSGSRREVDADAELGVASRRRSGSSDKPTSHDMTHNAGRCIQWDLPLGG